MGKNDFLQDFHIGKMIREIAFQQGISGEVIADVILRYRQNGPKIYQLKDLLTDDVVEISYVLRHNLLATVSRKYLSHIPCAIDHSEKESYSITLHRQTKRFTITGNVGNSDFLEDIHIGDYIRQIVGEKGWSKRYVAEQLKCAQNLLSYYLKSKHLKIKILIKMSCILNRNLIAEVYLSRMYMVSSLARFDDLTITMSEEEVHLERTDKPAILMVFRRMEDEK